MALCGDVALSLKGCGVGVSEEEEGSGFGLVRCTRGLGRKRVGISEGPEAAPLKRQCSGRLLLLDGSEKSGLEALPQDVLIRILCHVEHGDLKQLVSVSKTIKEATVVAKQWHFAYTTPTKIRAFRNSFDSQNDCDEIEAPNAPLRAFRSRISRKKLADVTTVLFASPDEGQWTRRGGLFMETEI